MRIGSRVRVLGLMALILHLAGCATGQSIQADHRAQLRDLHVQFAIPQEHFSFTAPAMGIGILGGAIPMLIESAVQQARQPGIQARTVALLDQLLEIDFRAEATEVLKHPPSKLSLQLAAGDVIPYLPNNQQHAARMAAQQPGDGYLLVVLHYELDPAKLVLTTRSRVVLWQQGKPTFISSVIYQGRTPAPGTDAVAAVRTQVREAVDQTLKLAALDLDSPNRPEHQRSSHVLTTRTSSLAVEGVVLAREGTRELLRANEKAMFSLDKEPMR